MNKTVIILTAALLMTAQPMTAQKKELSDARTILKSRANYDKAEKLMTDLIKKDTIHLYNPKVLLTWYESVQGQYEAANEKLYLKQKYDTVAFYTVIRRLQQVGLKLDSLEIRLDGKGKAAHRKSHGEYLNMLRPNLYFGGTYLVRKGDYRKAFDFFDTYIKAAEEPMFETYRYASTDTLLPVAAYWATLCGFKLQNPQLTLTHCHEALHDSQKAQFTLQYMCEAYLQQKDTPRYVATLTEGFSRFPDYPYFFPRLADYYTSQSRTDSVLMVADQGLKHDAKGRLFLLAKSVALLDLERYDECISTSQQLMDCYPEQAESYYNIATCHLNRALVVEQENEPRKNRERLQKLYGDARPMMEKYRELAPADQKRWAPALYRIYLNLNMGKQFEEIDRLMR